jgi:hypothetical protein
MLGDLVERVRPLGALGPVEVLDVIGSLRPFGPVGALDPLAEVVLVEVRGDARLDVDVGALVGTEEPRVALFRLGALVTQVGERVSPAPAFAVLPVEGHGAED